MIWNLFSYEKDNPSLSDLSKNKYFFKLKFCIAQIKHLSSDKDNKRFFLDENWTSKLLFIISYKI